jgi:cytochrome c nitrite reductase small subunit
MTGTSAEAPPPSSGSAGGRRTSAPSVARVLTLAVLCAFAVLLGLGAFTFVYAKGYSYLSDDPQACTNCHVMRDNYTSWSVSSHRSVTCNGCHTPHDLVGKYVTKAEHGARHSYVFTFEDPQVFRITKRSLDVVERNCVECHAPTLIAMVGGSTGVEERGPLRKVFDVESLGLPFGPKHEEGRCATCHRSVGHAG